MKTVGGNPFQIARPSRVRRFAPQDWLLRAGALLGAAIFAMGLPSNAWARHKQPLAATVWIANAGAFNAGSMETFAAGSKNNAKPLYRNTGTKSLLQYFPVPGAPFTATGLAGLALTPDNNHVTVVASLVNSVMTYTPTANGDVPPELIIAGPDTGLGLPNGDAYGPQPFFFDNIDTSQQVVLPTNALYVTNTATGLFTAPAPSPSATPEPCSYENPCGSVTVYPEGAGGSSLADPAIDAAPGLIIGGDPEVTYLAEPIGVSVDTTHAELCYLPPDTPVQTAYPMDYCDTVGTEYRSLGPYTQRVWVVNRYLGLITAYLPQAECQLGIDLGFGNFLCPGGSPIVDGPPTLQEIPPLGAAFFTTMDGLPTPPVGGNSSDPTDPNFLALQNFPAECLMDPGWACPQIYVTDLAGGFHNKGRVKIFQTYLSDTCLACDNGTCDADSTYCVLAMRGSMIGSPVAAIGGRKTKLKKPMGIAAAPQSLPPVATAAPQSLVAGIPDNLFVTNIDGNSITQFASTDSGNVRPEVKIKGRRTRMNQPTGIAVQEPLVLLKSHSLP